MEPISLGFAIGVPVVTAVASCITAVCYYRRRTEVQRRAEEEHHAVEIIVEETTVTDHSRESSPQLPTRPLEISPPFSQSTEHRDNYSPLSSERQNDIVTRTTHQTLKFNNTKSFEEFKARQEEQRSSEQVASNLAKVAGNFADKIPLSDTASSTTSSVIEGAKKALGSGKSNDAEASRGGWFSRLIGGSSDAAKNRKPKSGENSYDDSEEGSSKEDDKEQSVSKVQPSAPSPLAPPPVVVIQLSPAFETRKLQHSPDKASTGRVHRDSKDSILSGVSISSASSMDPQVQELKVAVKVATLQEQLASVEARRAKAQAEKAKAEAERDGVIDRLQQYDITSNKDVASHGSAHSHASAHSHEVARAAIAVSAPSRLLTIKTVEEGDEDRAPPFLLSPLTVQSVGSDDPPPPYSPSKISRGVGFREIASVNSDDPPPYSPSVRTRSDSIISSISVLDLGKSTQVTTADSTPALDPELLYESSPREQQAMSAQSLLEVAVQQADLQGKALLKASPTQEASSAAPALERGHARVLSVSSFMSTLSSTSSDSHTSSDSAGMHCVARGYTHGAQGALLEAVPEQPESLPQSLSPESQERIDQIRAYAPPPSGFESLLGLQIPSPICRAESGEAEVAHNNSPRVLSGAGGAHDEGE